MKEELEELKNEDNDFKVIDAGAKFTLFITMKNTNVNKTSEKIYDYIRETKSPFCRHIQRFVPILSTCKAYNDDIEKCVENVFNRIYNSNDTIKYTCMFKSSNNSTVKRDDIIKIVNKYFQTKNSKNIVDYHEPEYVILVQVIRNMCFISYLKEYFAYRKYNLVEMGIKYSAECSNETKNQQEEKQVSIENNKEEKIETFERK